MIPTSLQKMKSSTALKFYFQRMFSIKNSYKDKTDKIIIQDKIQYLIFICTLSAYWEQQIQETYDMQAQRRNLLIHSTSNLSEEVINFTFADLPDWAWTT